ncbi:unnamed protein product [Lasius platythorax]|uniref:Uncharacterized protein n=1 Tax=Lasius platythorax TaxID=488582 RepID=A0AAV2N050_9HYME
MPRNAVVGADVGKISSSESSTDCSSPASVGAAARTKASHVRARGDSVRKTADGSSSLKAFAMWTPS